MKKDTKLKPLTRSRAELKDAFDQQQQLVASFSRWQGDPVLFFEECLMIRLSNQQREFITLYGEMMKAKCKSSNKVEMTDRERELASKVGISVHSGKGLGKDFIVAGLIIYMVLLFEPFKGICTAGSKKQLEDVLSTEVKKLLKRNPAAQLHRYIIVDQGGIYRVLGSKKTENFMSKRGCNVAANSESVAETMTGYHEDFMLMVVDEASGVPDPVIVPLETTLTGFCNIAILIGNVTRSNGYFFSSHYGSHDRNIWEHVRWDAEESDLDDIKPGLKAQISRVAEKYGRDSNAFRMNVKGLPPIAEADSLIPLDLIYAARDRWHESETDSRFDPLVLGVDLGRGNDESVMYFRRGNKGLKIEVLNVRDTAITVDWISNAIDENDPDAVFIDSIGLGGPICDELRRRGHNIIDVNVSESTAFKAKFERRRDELWFKVWQEFESRRISIPDDEELILELSAIKVKDTVPKFKIESKKQMKARGVRSPNRADALMMSYYRSSLDLGRMHAVRDKYAERRPLGGYRLENAYNWMAC